MISLQARAWLIPVNELNLRFERTTVKTTLGISKCWPLLAGGRYLLVIYGLK